MVGWGGAAAASADLIHSWLRNRCSERRLLLLLQCGCIHYAKWCVAVTGGLLQLPPLAQPP